MGALGSQPGTGQKPAEAACVLSQTPPDEAPPAGSWALASLPGLSVPSILGPAPGLSFPTKQ